VRWQGSLSHLHSLSFAAHVAGSALQRRGIAPEAIDFAVLGTTVPQKSSFYGVPWLMGQLGAPQVGGPTIAQACATSARMLHTAASEVLTGGAQVVLAVAADRTSNGPHLYYPAPHRPGGTGEHEDWILDNFQCDPWAKVAMVQTAENVARKHGISMQEQHEVTLQRYAQYAQALADDSAFLRRFMDLPFEVPDAGFRKTVATLSGDEGIHATDAQALARLKPVIPGGTVTYGAQTHPADGHAAMVLTTPARARELSRDAAIDIRVCGFGQSRVDMAHMPEAPVPAAHAALARANLKPADLAVIKTHNPFAVNDIVLARDLGLDTSRINNYGCSLVWGHPQGPTGLRAIIELIEELVIRGGGHGLFTGCAAGDTAMAVVIEVGARR
jgi:acetyl-CoA acetyltransferase family protein